MNVKEIAQTVNKDERSVRRWVKKASDKMSGLTDKMSDAEKTKKPADYTFEETIAIIESGLGKNAALIWKTNAEKRNAMYPIPTMEIAAESDSVRRGMELVFGAIGKLDERLAKIETRIEQRQALLPAPSMKPRDHINKIVREYANNNHVHFPDAYARLYREFGYRTNSNPSVAAKNRGMTIIDYIESEGQIETLESVAVEIFI